MQYPLNSPKTHAAVIGVTETWMDNTINDSEVEIENYNLERRDRNRNGGGVCIFVRSDISYNLRDDLPVLKDLESIWIDIMIPKSKPLVICVCYRIKKTAQFFQCFGTSLFTKVIALMATKPSF